jgi:hypothetical protein
VAAKLRSGVGVLLIVGLAVDLSVSTEFCSPVGLIGGFSDGGAQDVRRISAARIKKRKGLSFIGLI